MEWNNEKVLKFLELLSRERSIWDPFNKSHKLKYKINNAWKRISDNFGNVPIEELKFKKKSLMATFRPLLKKKQASIRSGADADEDEVFQPTWFAYDIMESFLGPIYDVGQTYNTEDLDTNSRDDCSTTSNSQIPQKKKKLENKEIHSSWVNLDTNSRNDFNTTSSYRIDPKKKKLKNLSLVIKEIKELREGNSNREENEFELFGRLVATQLKALPLPRAIEAQQHIQSYINEYRLSHYKEMQPTSSQYLYSRSPSST